ncbi:MAG TPA: ABC transporter ATP-binding protein [Vicinamibacterales bacterium]|jgi:lipopolysaccharide transport system ATP-binding protein|nr:ABC transporter ATP-binding protein [Vicinamibacterales bacterium]
MSLPIVIRAERLAKRYRLGSRNPVSTAREAIAGVVNGLFSRRAPDADPGILWALDDVSFEVHAGDTVGIVGRNGAGKSTLLKILSRITEPTRGFADVTGRVGSLLEVGTGFHADLTGRENTYLNGAILGMKRAEIDRKFDEIVAFAEVERFIDTPVKYYSSGMYMRLAFAVAAHLETEILVVDEVLAVGDMQFQKKCLGKMDDIARHGRTVLFISHNLEAIQRLCTKGLLLDQGKLIASGAIHDVVSQYRLKERRLVDIGRFNPRGRAGTGWARIRDVRLLDSTSRPVSGIPAEADLTFAIDLELENAASAGASLRGLIVEIVVLSDQGQPLLSLMSIDDPGVELPPAGACRLMARLAGPTFLPGRYRLNLFLGIPDHEHVDEVPDAFEFEVLPPVFPWRPYEMHLTRQIVCRKADWSCVVHANRGVAAAVSTR